MSYVGLLDCNNFFVSCERLFRPDLLGKPVAVLSSNDGCIIARSEEVKALGIPMGVPYFKVRDICERKSVTIFSSNFTLYRDISARVMQVLEEEVSGVQVYSIDEAFFNLRKADPHEVKRIRASVMQQVGIPVSVGVAATKTLAKYASAKAKKSTGACILSTAVWKREADTVPCGSVWGIGGRSATAFRKHGIETAKDLMTADPEFVRAAFGVMGARLQFELNGISAQGLGTEHGRESIMSSRSFGKNTSLLSALESAVAYHVTHAAAKIRSQGKVATRLRVSLRPSRHGVYAFRGGAREVVLSEPTASTAQLLHEALRIVGELYEADVPYKKAGITLSGLLPEAYASNSLFGGAADIGVDHLTDALNARFGRGTILSAISLRSDSWQSRTDARSPEYTTRWSEIASARA